ncbi:DUF397 domain-containing protein [Streptomyces sp. NPDC087294]|uniref:DUF397 domain-containing protein n=1 Tax=Streptomyces sp. NPDC087294 TaxID=3365777 RepID=UPI003804B9C1
MSELHWFKSTHSGAEGGECVEVALSWSKSSYSGAQSGDCVEVAATPATVHVRDSKSVAGPVFSVSRAAWVEFIEVVS